MQINSRSQNPSARPARRFRRIVTGSVLLTLTAIALFFAERYTNSSSDWAPNVLRSYLPSRPAPKPVVLSDSLRAIAEPLPGIADRQGPIAASDFSRAYARLDNALQKRTGAKPDELLSRAGDNHPSACPIRWNDGEPVMAFNQKLSLTQALNRCADAVESLP